MPRSYRLIDADCHTVEPPHPWETCLAPEFCDRAPRLVKDEEGGDAWSIGEGKPLLCIGIVSRDSVGVRNMAWSTDSPHHGNDGPYGRKTLSETMDGVPADERHAICAFNTIRIYGLPQGGNA